MKKVISAILCTILIFALLSGCGNQVYEKISSKNISIIIGTIICCEKTVKTMIIIAEISFTGPFKL